MFAACLSDSQNVFRGERSRFTVCIRKLSWNKTNEEGEFMFNLENLRDSFRSLIMTVVEKHKVRSQKCQIQILCWLSCD